MAEPHEPNRTADAHPEPGQGRDEPEASRTTDDLGRTTGGLSSEPADSLDAALAAGFAAPRPSLGDARLVSPRGAEGDGAGAAAGGSLPSVPGYRVLREIARGGMGRVLAAFDLGLERDVALKVLLPGTEAERFVRESKITARLPHPSIPPVHALGTLDDGSPFLAMKLVAGQTLAEEMKGADRPRLLQAFAQVCQAVGFAHSKGIIHRDLKPANVMVGEFGEVQVMDWGLAKDLSSRGGEVTDDLPSPEASPTPLVGADANQTTDHRGAASTDDERTRAGQVMGTPAYMAPEQARGEVAQVDARSDVFALGGILCAILTGMPPYSGGKSALEVIRRAATADLAEAHARLDGCGADAELVALCRACLSAVPAGRPMDGRAVADALTAHLDGVQERLQAAQREHAAALAREAEQRKRRKVLLALAATVLLAVLGAAAGAGVYLLQAQLRQGRTAEAVSGLLDRTEEALRSGDAAGAEVLLDAADKRAAEGGAGHLAGRRDRLRADLGVLNGLDRVDRFRWTVVKNQLPELAVVAARFREVLREFGLRPEAVLAEEASARVSDSAVRDRLVTALDWWLREETLPWLRDVLGAADPHPFRDAVRDAFLANDQEKLAELAGWNQAAEQPPGFVAVLVDYDAIPVERRWELLTLAVLHRPDDLGLLMALGNTCTDGKDSVDERLRWFQAAVAVAPRNSAAHNNLGITLFDKGQLDGAVACYRKAIALDQKFPIAHNNLGNALLGKGKVVEAIASFEKAIALDPKSALAHSNLGNALQAKGQVEEAIASFRKAIALDSKSAGAHSNLGFALYGKGQMDEAIACHRKAIELDPKLAAAHNNLGVALSSKGQVEEAIACFQKAIALDPKYAQAHNGLGGMLAAKGQFDEAIACHRKAIEIDPKYVNAHNSLGGILCDVKGDYAAAIASFRKAIDLDQKNVEAHFNLGNALGRKGQLDEAIASYRTTIELDPKFANAHFILGFVLGRKGQLDEAIASYHKAIEIDPKNANAHCFLGHALTSRGRFAEALAAHRRGHELGTKQADWRHPSAEWVRQAESLAALEGKLPAVLEGKAQPRDNEERLALMAVCQAKKLHHAAVRLYADALAASPKLGADHKAEHRYNAACSAALAGGGQGEDAGKLGGAERLALRRQALTWLRADLTLWARLFAEGEVGRSRLPRILTPWQKYAALAAVRDKDALDKLSREERAACERLWADVAALLKKAETPKAKETKK